MFVIATTKIEVFPTGQAETKHIHNSIKMWPDFDEWEQNFHMREKALIYREGDI